MRPRTIHRWRYALRLVASVFLLSSPCGGRPSASPAMQETMAAVATTAGDRDGEAFAPAIHAMR